MSRIHEALKKAQEQRSAHQAAPTEPGHAATAGASLSVPAVADPTIMADALPAMSLGAPPTPQSLLANCRQTVWKPDASLLLFETHENHQVGKEVFRTLRTRLYQARSMQPLRSILVTSALPGEGKTFITSNLAQSMVRQRERRVLLIDADLRLSRLHVVAGAPASPGLSDYLSGEASESDILQRGNEENLYLIPGGKPVSNPTELLGNGRLEQLLPRLAQVFDWILLDSPPAIPVSDASIVAKHCDGILMVFRAGTTPFHLAQKACQEFPTTPLVGAVLNCADHSQYYGGYDYGHYLSESEDTAKQKQARK
jgi:protein-tyrosine kinase